MKYDNYLSIIYFIIYSYKNVIDDDELSIGLKLAFLFVDKKKSYGL